MQIVLNGERHEVTTDATLALLIEVRQLSGRRLAVEVNEQIVPRSQYAKYHLQEGDRIEIVQAIGGG